MSDIHEITNKLSDIESRNINVVDELDTAHCDIEESINGLEAGINLEEFGFVGEDLIVKFSTVAEKMIERLQAISKERKKIDDNIDGLKNARDRISDCSDELNDINVDIEDVSNDVDEIADEELDSEGTIEEEVLREIDFLIELEKVVNRALTITSTDLGKLKTVNIQDRIQQLKYSIGRW